MIKLLKFEVAFSQMRLGSLTVIYVYIYVACVQDAVLRHPTTNQAARAANIVHAMLQFRRQIEREELAPVSRYLRYILSLLYTLPGFCCLHTPYVHGACTWQHELKCNSHLLLSTFSPT